MHDVVIIGSGPAGLSAAISCRENNLEVVVVDEFPKAGGRLLGQLHQEPTGEWWNGIKETEALLERANALQTDIRLEVSVYHVEKNDETFKVYTNKGTIESKNVLIATGAAETAAPIPGWTLPGVMSIGAAQVMTNVHRVKVGEKGIVVGVNVLSAAIAREMQLAGVNLHSMALPAANIVTGDQSNPRKVMDALARIAHLAPSKFIQFGSRFARASSFVRNTAVKFFPPGGVKMWGMPVHIRKAILSINGEDKVESVTMCKVTTDGAPIAGTEEEIDVDFVCIAGGLYPLVELAAVMGVPFKYIEELGGHVPVHNEQMETPIEGLYVAGNITGIESAKVAGAQGTVAGYSIAKHALGDEAIGEHVKNSMEQVKTVRANASIQFHPKIDQGRARIAESFEVNHS
ncbi:MAG TPA: NAD(P)/FAD-dependent oxidoreductase [Bacillota bacterium]|nr:NAD(P)/FAD-dependent oxidoreductase [Bacillota bacterium]